ncbi:hypothetical protein CEXT_334821 [Caerostris extrusa]|uniref:Uncharacterized protein n=1 Tax=Caerostris extrusa TaxID=172846 RepID=A0AAV4UZ28_CAEEX|nr:hypothetical protein CEXT_334821 [Caerostris extrusa]
MGMKINTFCVGMSFLEGRPVVGEISNNYSILNLDPLPKWLGDCHLWFGQWVLCFLYCQHWVLRMCKEWVLKRAELTEKLVLGWF